ncbi:translation initiation factor 3 subunit K [Strigomonas culicis]|uniref:Translation initiation factor 3 subunit K n=1 Tax=Strigomonas culicis TaxID=28005 RepID=S9WA30_9TRYP|nr:translation initiation factor 3 subunit K [Strigomonas culicis]|eukprot:EPY32775.1 translation initiation factor 3 subunit K [Strigomonas culicis]
MVKRVAAEAHLVLFAATRELAALVLRVRDGLVELLDRHAEVRGQPRALDLFHGEGDALEDARADPRLEVKRLRQVLLHDPPLLPELCELTAAKEVLELINVVQLVLYAGRLLHVGGHEAHAGCEVAQMEAREGLHEDAEQQRALRLGAVHREALQILEEQRKVVRTFTQHLHYILLLRHYKCICKCLRILVRGVYERVREEREA